MSIQELQEQQELTNAYNEVLKRIQAYDQARQELECCIKLLTGNNLYSTISDSTEQKIIEKYKNILGYHNEKIYN